jgi:hypothetical protein
MANHRIRIDVHIDVTDELAVREAAFHRRAAHPIPDGSDEAFSADLAELMSSSVDTSLVEVVFAHISDAMDEVSRNTTGLGPFWIEIGSAPE